MFSRNCHLFHNLGLVVGDGVEEEEEKKKKKDKRKKKKGEKDEEEKTTKKKPPSKMVGVTCVVLWTR